MWKIFWEPFSVHQVQERKKVLFYLLVANTVILSLATAIVGITIYGTIFFLSFFFWLPIWGSLLLFNLYLSAWIGNCLLRIQGEKQKMIDILLAYGLAYGVTFPFILVYTCLEVLAFYIRFPQILFLIVVILALARYIQLVVYGLKEISFLSKQEKIAIVLVSILPQVFFYLLF